MCASQAQLLCPPQPHPAPPHQTPPTHSTHLRHLVACDFAVHSRLQRQLHKLVAVLEVALEALELRVGENGWSGQEVSLGCSFCI